MSNQIIQIKDGSDNIYPVIEDKIFVKQFKYTGSSPNFSGFVMDAIGSSYFNLTYGEIGMIYGLWQANGHFLITVLRIDNTNIYFTVTNDANIYVGVYNIGSYFNMHTCSMAN